MILSFFNNQTYQRVLLPVLNNADFSYTLGRARFWLDEDVTLNFEIVDKVWRICSDSSYRFMKRSEDGYIPVADKEPLIHGDEFRIFTANGEEMTMTIRDTGHLVRPFIRLMVPKNGITIGTDEHQSVIYTEGKRIIKRHAMISRSDNNVVITNLAEDGIYINGQSIRGAQKLSFGDLIDIYGLRLIFLTDSIAVEQNDDMRLSDRAVPVVEKESAIVEAPRRRTSGDTLYRRAPRLMEPVNESTIAIELPPDPEKQRNQTLFQVIGNSVLMVVPMIVGCSMMIASSRMTGGSTSLFMFSGLAMAVTSALVGVIWGLTNASLQKKEAQATENHRFEAYSSYLIGKADEIKKIYEENREILYKMYPSAGECLEYGRARSLLWNRNSTQEDFLKVRLGIGNMPFQVTISVPDEKFSLIDDILRQKPAWIKKNYETLYDVPLLLDLGSRHLIGIVGGEEKFGAYEIMRIICLQLCATHSYTDLKMAFLYDASMEQDKWAFARWLPHTWSEDRKIRYVGGNAAEIGDVCYELNNIFHERMEKSSDREKKEGFMPRFVIFISDPSLIEGELLARYVYKDAGTVGLSTLILSDIRENLPNACDYFVFCDEEIQGMGTSSDIINISFDKVSDKQMDDYARRITGIRVKETSKGGELPESVTFMEMYGAVSLDDLEVRERWLKNRTYDNIRGLLGVRGGGQTQFLDLHEKYHGPHGLVAGTTGSGKSETLQTYLMSLAVEYSPDDISFFVIDYKGGGMANLFTGLPHLSGSISNLSGAQIQRAMVSIKSENRRRQRMFNEARVNNINKYTRLYKDGEVQEPIPHLFIIVDEFAELKREEPDFMRELISVAQVGRSLGVHLILSTQKPSGTVDDNIWSNSKFRLCLRVQTKDDSMDMLGKPDAAYITQAGRGYLQVGSDEVYELFQSGYSGAVFDPESDENREATALFTRTGKVEMRYFKHRKDSVRQSEITQLDAVKEYLRELADNDGYAQTHRLWMPILKNPIYLEDFEEYMVGAADENGWKTDEEQMCRNWDLSVVVGQTDDPRNQEQLPLKISFASGGSHSVVGSIVSGKSTLLQTIVYSLATTYSPKYVNFYAIDYSSRMLSAFEALPHMGGVLYEGETEKTKRFFNMLGGILAERKERYRGGNYIQYVRANGVTEPAIILIIDNFGAFTEKTAEIYLPFLLDLSKEGVSNGIYMILAAGGYGMKEIPGRLAENLGTAMALAMADKFAYSDVLHTLHVDVIPETSYKGRGLCKVGDDILEYQSALAIPAEDDYQRMEKIRSKCEELRSIWDGNVARRIPEIPEKPVWEDFEKLPDVMEAFSDDRYLPIGYRKDNAEVYKIDLYNVYCYMAAGQKYSGKTSLIRLMALSACAKAAAVQRDDSTASQVVVIDGQGVLKDLGNVTGIRMVVSPEELYRYCMDELTPLFKERNLIKHRLEEMDLEDEDYYHEMADMKPVFIFISNLVWFIKTVYSDTHDMKGFMETLFKKGQGHKIYFIAALPLEDRAQAAGYEAFNLFTGYGTGIHLGGNVSQDPYMKFTYMQYADQMKPELPGTGLLPDAEFRRVTDRIVIPFAAKRHRPKQDDRLAHSGSVE